MNTPSRQHVMRTLLAAVLDLAILGAIALVVVYIYELGLLQAMLNIFPRFDHIGLIGFILVPILIVVMLIYGAFCAVVTCVLLILFLAVGIALLITLWELSVNLFAEAWAVRDPLVLLRDRLLGVWRGVRRVVRRGP